MQQHAGPYISRVVRRNAAAAPLGEVALRALCCAYCGKVWAVRASEAHAQSVCPYCGERTREHVRPEPDGTFGSALCLVMDSFAEGQTAETDRLREELLRLAPDHWREIRLFLRAVYPEHDALVRNALRASSEEEREKCLAELHDLLIYEEGLASEWADNLCAAIRCAALLRSRGGSELAHVTVSAFREVGDTWKPTVAQDGVQEIDGMIFVDGKLVVYTGNAEELTVPDGVTSIMRFACYDNKTLRRIRLPNSLREIGAEAFLGCSALSEIVFPDVPKSSNHDILKRLISPEGMRRIGESAFEACVSLKQLTLPESVSKIGASAFSGCKSLERIALPKGLREIPTRMLSGCEKLTEVSLPQKLEKVGEYAFYSCEAIQKLSFPTSLVRIDAFAFDGCKALKEIDLPWNAKLDDYALGHTGSTELSCRTEVRYYE